MRRLPIFIAGAAASAWRRLHPRAASNSGSIGSTLGDGADQASASTTLLPFSVLAGVFSPHGPGNTARASAFATYSFQVIGGNDGDIVPILIGVTVETRSRQLQNPSGWAQANFVTFTSVDGLVAGPQVCTYVAICQSFVTSFSGTRSRHAASGAVGDFVNLTVEASATGIPGFDEFADAFADPFIYIDPSFPNASLYSIVVSSGVGNVPLAPAPVPEPASAVLFAMGVLCCAPAPRLLHAYFTRAARRHAPAGPHVARARVGRPRRTSTPKLISR
jgi:hypothetical protein